VGELVIGEVQQTSSCPLGLWPSRIAAPLDDTVVNKTVK
jgi:hypothetical protein